MSTKTYDQIYAGNPVTTMADSDRLVGYPAGGPMYGILVSNFRTVMVSTALLLDGSHAMTAGLPGFAGTESLPGYTFNGDLDTGMRQVSANKGGLTGGGLDYLNWSATGIEAMNGASFIGPLQGAVGGVTPAAGAFTTVNASGLVALAAALTVGTTLGVTGLATFSGGANMTPAAAPATNAVGYLGLPQLTKSGDYTLTMTEAGKSVYWSATATATIPANGSVAFPIGTVIQLAVNATHTLTVAITTDTLRWLPSSSTGSRTVTGPGFLTIEKVTATEWWGFGLNVT